MHPISDEAYGIPLLEYDTHRQNADVVAKNKTEEYGFRPIFRDDFTENNSMYGGG